MPRLVAALLILLALALWALYGPAHAIVPLAILIAVNGQNWKH